jgi:hypothetical protein
LSDDFEAAGWYERLAVGALILASGYIVLAAAWLVEGFAQQQPRKD